MLNLLILILTISCIGVISLTNSIYCVLLLIWVFLLLTCFIIILGLEFLALIILIVYVGAVAILFLFVVLIIKFKPVKQYLPLGLFFGFLLFSFFLLLIKDQVLIRTWDPLWVNWLDLNNTTENVQQVGWFLYEYNGYLVLNCGFLIIIVIIGALIIGKRKIINHYKLVK